MSTLLEIAIEKVVALPKDEQDAIASQILASLAGENAWKKRFAEKLDVVPVSSHKASELPANQHLEESMEEEQIREALNAHWRASAAGDANAEHDIYDDNAICDYPQSGERIFGRANLQALRSHHPGKPSGFNIKRILGKGDLWITEYTIVYQGRPAYTVSIMEFRDGKAVHETQYFADPFEAPAWRSQWVGGSRDAGLKYD